MSDRICYITINARPSNITVISAYAPTNDHDLAVRSVFFNTLQAVIANVPHGHFLVVGLDANAKLGQSFPANRSVGPLSTGVQCENGSFLRDLCLALNLAVANTFFQHKLKQKVTWCSPNGKTKNEINYIFVRSR